MVGTSWDYPPFSSVDPTFQVVGMDIALIEKENRAPISAYLVSDPKLCIRRSPRALNINQIDLAVAAMAITPERAGELSFSSIS